MSVTLKGKRGFYPTEKGGIYFRLYDNGKTGPRTCQIKAMHLIDKKEVIIYSERDREFLVISADKSILVPLGKSLIRGMTIAEIISTGMSRKIFHSRIKLKRLPWEDVSIYTNDNRFYHYLKNA